MTSEWIGAGSGGAATSRMLVLKVALRGFVRRKASFNPKVSRCGRCCCCSAYPIAFVVFVTAGARAGSSTNRRRPFQTRLCSPSLSTVLPFVGPSLGLGRFSLFCIDIASICRGGAWQQNHGGAVADVGREERAGGDRPLGGMHNALLCPPPPPAGVRYGSRALPSQRSILRWNSLPQVHTFSVRVSSSRKFTFTLGLFFCLLV